VCGERLQHTAVVVENRAHWLAHFRRVSVSMRDTLSAAARKLIPPCDPATHHHPRHTPGSERSCHSSPAPCHARKIADHRRAG
jgi:hypothetical protein